MPLSLPVIPMTMAEFSAMPHQLGWKHEYWDGAARLSPKASAVVEFRRAIVRPVTVAASDSILIRSIEPFDADALAQLFESAFESAIEFAGYSTEMLRERAKESMAEFFAPDHESDAERRAQQPKAWANASFVAEVAGQLVGAAMVRKIRVGPILEPVFIAPDWQRRGIGALLLDATLKALNSVNAEKSDEAAVDFLYSRCHLGNPASLAWHIRHGFEEIPNLPTAQHRWQHYLQQAHALRQQGNVAAAATAQAEADRLAGQIADLEASQDPSAWGLLSS